MDLLLSATVLAPTENSGVQLCAYSKKAVLLFVLILAPIDNFFFVCVDVS